MLLKTVIVFLVFMIAAFAFSFTNNNKINIQKGIAEQTKILTETLNNNPLSIGAIKNAQVNGGTIETSGELDPGANYRRYLVSYKSEGFKINGLLTVPTTEQPEGGYPAIIFGHGYIPPLEYRTTERYIAYVDSLAQAGYVVFKIDYRGHHNSEGRAEGAYFSPAYTMDTLNAADAVSKLSYVNPQKIGAWGHSMAGMILTRALVAKPNVFRVAVIWGGVVGSYEDIQREWWSKRRRTIPSSTPSQLNVNRSTRQAFIAQHGEPKDTNEFWKSISPKSYISELTAPILLEHGEADETVPFALSVQFADALKKAGKTVDIHTYPGADHDISSPFFETAMQRTIEFFDKYLK